MRWLQLTEKLIWSYLAHPSSPLPHVFEFLAEWTIRQEFSAVSCSSLLSTQSENKYCNLYNILKMYLILQNNGFIVYGQYFDNILTPTNLFNFDQWHLFFLCNIFHKISQSKVWNVLETFMLKFINNRWNSILPCICSAQGLSGRQRHWPTWSIRSHQTLTFYIRSQIRILSVHRINDVTTFSILLSPWMWLVTLSRRWRHTHGCLKRSRKFWRWWWWCTSKICVLASILAISRICAMCRRAWFL